MSESRFHLDQETARKRVHRIGRREKASVTGCFAVVLLIVGLITTSFLIGWLTFPPTLLTGCGLVSAVILLPGVLLLALGTVGMEDRDAEVYRFIDETDLDRRIDHLVEVLDEGSRDSREVRIAAMRLAILKVDDAAREANRKGVTPIELEAYLEMNIKEKPGFAHCDPRVIGPLLDYIESLRAGKVGVAHLDR